MDLAPTILMRDNDTKFTAGGEGDSTIGQLSNARAEATGLLVSQDGGVRFV